MIPWAAVVGAANVRQGGDADAVDGVVPGAVAQPARLEEIQAIVRLAAERGAVVMASGLGAHLDRGAPPRRVDLVLRLDRMGAVRAHEAADMTITVEAGCDLVRLGALLARAGQWLPLDPPRLATTTVGGLLAADLSGPLRASQGTARDLLLGLRVVGAGGDVVASGGRVVKNVAGYDLHKLHVGALGTLGVIVEATFKVRPRPEREEAVVIPCPSARVAAEVALAVRDRIDPLWLEVAGARALPDGPGAAAAALVGLGGIDAEVVTARAIVLDTVARFDLRGVAVAEGAVLRARLADFAAEPAAAVLRASVLPSDVGETMEAAERLARESGVDVRCLAHAANGVVRMSLADAGVVVPLLAALRPAVAARDGWFVVERAEPAVKRGLDVWGDPGPPLALMRSLASALDPPGVFAAGRFAGGI